jgi:APA family basic amino acid/polyamine antiporter
VPAILIIAGITALLILGIRESSQVNNAIVVIKLLVLALFLFLGLGHINSGFWQPFLPFGWSGVIGRPPSFFSRTSDSIRFLPP